MKFKALLLAGALALSASPALFAQATAQTAEQKQVSEAYGLLRSGKAAEALPTLKDLSAKGVGDATYLLAEVSRQGIGGPKDAAEGRRLMELAVQQGSDSALRILAEMKLSAEGGPKDEASAAQLFRRAADKGDDRAIVPLAGMHYEGFNGARDLAEARRLFKLAADRGDGGGLACHAMMLFSGEGGPADELQASATFKKLADAGQLGVAFCVNKAAEAGEGWAKVAIGKALLSGSGGLKADAVKGLSYLKAAADAGNETAIFALLDYYKKGPAANPAEAGRYAVKLADLDPSKGYRQYDAGTAYLNGEGVPRDPAKAMSYFKRGEDDADSYYQLGLMYAGGIGVPANQDEAARYMGNATCCEAKAVAWLADAAAKGNPRAQLEYAEALDFGGEGIKRDEAKAMEWFRKAAANKGFAEGKYRLGSKLTFSDKEQSRRLWREAADAGYTPAMTALGNETYRDAAMAGLGKDHSKEAALEADARRWMDRAIAAGDVSAMKSMGERETLFGIPVFSGPNAGQRANENYKRDALRWYRMAADRGDRDAREWVGKAYMNGGGGVQRNYQEALRWLRTSIEPGRVSDTMDDISKIYAEGGDGVARDLPLAYLWSYRNASSTGKQYSGRPADLLKKMTATEKERAQRLLWSCEVKGWVDCGI